MKEVGAVDGYSLLNTHMVGDRLIQCTSSSDNKLVVSELVLGDQIWERQVVTNIPLTGVAVNHFPSCSFNNSVLLINMDGNADYKLVYAAIVRVDFAQTERLEVSVSPLTIDGEYHLRDWTFLCQLSDDEVAAFFYDWNEWYIIDVHAGKLGMKKMTTQTTFSRGFGTAPVQHSSGCLLVAGGEPLTMEITSISASDGRTQFQRVGVIPGRPRVFVSCTLVGDRFLIGFGGSLEEEDTDEMFIFDYETGGSSLVSKSGSWHCCCQRAILSLQGETLYVIGGAGTTKVHSIGLEDLTSLISDAELQRAFANALCPEWSAKHPARDFKTPIERVSRDLKVDEPSVAPVLPGRRKRRQIMYPPRFKVQGRGIARFLSIDARGLPFGLVPSNPEEV